MITVYTDGACKGNPGPGGWAAIVIDESGTQNPYFGGPIPNTTNQRMEVLAAIEGLGHTPAASEIKLFSDSLYVVNTMMKGWKRNANTDLWARLDQLVVKRKIRFEWVKGHNGHPIQEEVDRLASLSAGGVKR